MSKWIVSIIAAAVVVCVGAGVGLGWHLWGGSGGTDAISDLERQLAQSRETLGSARATIDELARRERAVTDALTKSERYNRELEDRNTEITTALTGQTDELSAAISGSRSITEIIRAVRESIERYAATVTEARPP